MINQEMPVPYYRHSRIKSSDSSLGSGSILDMISSFRIPKCSIKNMGADAGSKVENDIECVLKSREAPDDKIELRFDANRGYMETEALRLWGTPPACTLLWGGRMWPMPIWTVTWI